jgi:hypothetical protein
MSPKELTAFRVDPDVMDGLRRVKDRDGVPLSVQLDRALRAWLKQKRISITPARSASDTGRKMRRPSRRVPR